MAEVKMPRKEAARVLERVRSLLANRCHPDVIEKILEQEFQIPPLKECNGDAHSNPHIDNCGVCAPRWGWTGATIKIT